MDSRSDAWRGIWQKKYATVASEKASQAEACRAPHVCDGFDSLSHGQWKKLTGYFIRKIVVGPGDDVLEVGCGVGAFLEQLPPCGSIAGVDFSENAVRLIKGKLSGNFRVAGAASLPFADRSFDVAISWSVFFYFDSFEYAKKALSEMKRVTRPGGRIFVGDVNDLEKKPLARKLREKSRTARERRYTSGSTADQLYYPKDFFRSYAESNGMTIAFYDESVEELAFYENSRYRYSLVIKRA